MDAWNGHDLLDRMQIVDLLNRIHACYDRRRWADVRACFTAEVDLDYTSVGGGEPARVNMDAQIEEWRAGVAGFTATVHLIANHVVTLNGDTARAMTNGHATHFLPNDKGESFWTCGGYYDYLLSRTPTGWRVCGMKFTMAWARGNHNLLQMAARK